MTTTALNVAAALAIVFVGALIASWWDDRKDWTEHLDDCPECHAAGKRHREPLSNLDRWDGVRARDELQP